ncbi:MAG: hypothetical protein PHI48_12190 [Bacteroidales bacterium]|nr:hypothetical protein [Bacteroidales bacterium]
MRKTLFLLTLIGSLSLLDAQNRVSWIPSKTDKADLSSSPLTEILRPMDGKCRLLSCSYEEERLVSRTTIDRRGAWDYTCIATPVKDEKGALDLAITFRLKEGELSSAGVAVAFDFYKWKADNYVMIPASVYNGNRNRIVNRSYASGLDRTDMYRKDLPLTTSPVPQLSPVGGELSRLEVLACNATTPAICLYDRKNKSGFIVLSEQGIQVNNELLDHGLIVEENSDRTIASLVISAPGVREKKPEFIGFSKSPDRGIEWKAGDERTIHLRIYRFAASDMAAFLDKFMTVRKSVTGTNTPRNLIPFSEVARLMCTNIDNRYYKNSKSSFYCPENANWISFGWIGGLINTFPMLALDDQKYRERVRNTFDFGLTLGQGESGYFYGALDNDGKVFGREGYDEMPEIVLTRKNADVLFWMVKQFMLLKAQGHTSEIKPDWERRVKLLADAFVTTWKRDGQWGNFLNNKTGEIALFNTSGGVMAIGGLALAAQYYQQPEYLKVAIQAANYYYSAFLKEGMTTGACADILQNADSETAAALMTSLMTLYEQTGEMQWLKKSTDLANLCATWTVSFDYKLPSNTPLAKLGAKLAGAVWASTQNKHGAPGFCTSSGDPLFKIFRATGDERYASLLYDIAHAHAEGIQPGGLITERLTYCDADSRGSRGDGGKTGWNETNGALMAMELPGIYLRTDMDRMFVFDHVVAEVVSRDKSGVKIRITNPTKYVASVSILAENKEKAGKALGCTSFIDWPKIVVNAGETVVWKIKK